MDDLSLNHSRRLEFISRNPDRTCNRAVYNTDEDEEILSPSSSCVQRLKLKEAQPMVVGCHDSKLEEKLALAISFCRNRKLKQVFLNCLKKQTHTIR